MTGEKKRDDDSDFLDDDFIVEDLGGKGEDLDKLFDMPAKPKKAPAAGDPTDPDDVLFTDDTKGLDQSFEGTPQFAESGPSTWNGDGLELEPNARPKPKSRGGGLLGNRGSGRGIRARQRTAARSRRSARGW
jgi:hypothetical protein